MKKYSIQIKTKRAKQAKIVSHKKTSSYTVTREKGDHKMKKESIHQEDKNFNYYASNHRHLNVLRKQYKI